MPIDKGASEETKTDKKSGPGATPGTPEKDPKDKPETGPVGANPAEERDKLTPPPHKQPHPPNTIHNRDQDPNHPANTTLSPPPQAAAERYQSLTTGGAPEDYMTEQEKDALATGFPSAKVPYPTGNPPPSFEETTRGQGIWRGDEDDFPGTPGTNAPDTPRVTSKPVNAPAQKKEAD
jgi:hypothetical protein